MYSEDDVNALARILWWEARGEPEKGQVAVCNVVINRTRDKRWPNTIQDVIAQPAQFTPYGNPSYGTVAIPAKQMDIARRALSGERAVPDDYYYYSVGKATRYAKDFVQIGNHWFGRDIRDGDLMETVKLGSKGNTIKTLQALLTQKGHPCGAIDGIFGAKTDAAVKTFQAANKLDVDGIVGPMTWAALQTAPSNISAGNTDRLEDWGFGDLIAAKGRTYAVKQFQAAMGLTVDGIEGPQTKSALAGEIIAPRISEDEMKCQCPGYCSGYPAGRASIGVRILAERIFREVEKTYPGAQFYITNRTHPTPNGAIAGGNRCTKWNKERGGAAGSMHKSGLAMDVWGHKDGVKDSVIRKRIEDVALSMNTRGGIGYEGTYIVHIDTRGSKSRWGY